MSAARTFPVMTPYRDRDKWSRCPRSVPWSVVEPFERRAIRNHDQTLARLAERGGLSPYELWSLVNDQPLIFDVARSPISQPDIVEWVRSLARPE